MVFWRYLVENKTWWLYVHTWADTHSPEYTHRPTHTYTHRSVHAFLTGDPSLQGALTSHYSLVALPALYSLLSEPGSPRSTPWGTELNASDCLGGDAKKPGGRQWEPGAREQWTNRQQASHLGTLGGFGNAGNMGRIFLGFPTEGGEAGVLTLHSHPWRKLLTTVSVPQAIWPAAWWAEKLLDQRKPQAPGQRGVGWKLDPGGQTWNWWSSFPHNGETSGICYSSLDKSLFLGLRPQGVNQLDRDKGRSDDYRARPWLHPSQLPLPLLMPEKSRQESNSMNFKNSFLHLLTRSS